MTGDVDIYVDNFADVHKSGRSPRTGVLSDLETSCRFTFSCPGNSAAGEAEVDS